MEGIGQLDTANASHTRFEQKPELLPNSLLRRAPIGFACIDRQLRYVWINEWLAGLNGLAPEDRVGKPVGDVVPSLLEMVQKVTSQILATGQAVKDHEFSGETLSAPGEQRCWKESWYPVYNEEQDIAAFGVVVEEITEQKRAAEQLRRNHDTFYHLIQNNPFGIYVVDADFKLRQVSVGSQKVFSNVHPLLGRDFAEVLRLIWAEPFASEAIAHFRHTLDTGAPYVSYSMVEQRRDIDAVEAYDWRIERITLPDGRFGVVCYRLDRLIQDVLNYSKIVSGDLEMVRIEPLPLLEEIIESYPHLQHVKNQITLRGPFLPVMANRAALTQVLSNLLGNAVKFVPAGVQPQVTVESERVEDKVRFQVKDNGIGIEPQAKERIFKLFQRLNPPGLYEGTGLGLAIVRKAVERMGGAVGVESQVGQGSRFWFDLKAAE